MVPRLAHSSVLFKQLMKSSKACRRWIRTPERNDGTRHPAEMKEKQKRARDVGDKKHIAEEGRLGLFNPCSRCSLLASKATPFLQAGPRTCFKEWKHSPERHHDRANVLSHHLP